MKYVKFILIIATLIGCSQDEKNDIEILKGVWVTENLDIDRESIKTKVSLESKLEIIDESNCQLTFMGYKELGKMELDQKKKLIKLKWKDKSINLEYNISENPTINMLTNNSKIRFLKTDKDVDIKKERIEGITLSKSAINGTWILNQKRGGGRKAASSFMLKESGAKYLFVENSAIQISLYFPPKFQPVL